MLLVDDEPDLGRLLEQHLVRAGQDVERCSTGTEGIARLDASPSIWAAAIVDLTLPDMSGTDVIARILALKPGLGIVVISGSPFDPAALHQAYPDSPIRFLHKPFRMAELTAALAAVCKHPEQGAT